MDKPNLTRTCRMSGYSRGSTVVRYDGKNELEASHNMAANR